MKQEIVARKKAELYLESSHGLLDSIFEHIPGMIVLKRVSDRRIARINQSGERMLNRSRDLLLGRSNEEIYSPALAYYLTQCDDQVLEQSELAKLPVQRVEMPSTEPRWIGYSKTVLRDRNGAPQYILEFGEDMTERENLDRRLKDQLNFHEQMIEAFPGPVFSKDTAGRYLAVNTSFEKFVAKPRSEIIGKTEFDIAPEQQANEYDAADRALMEAGGRQVYESQVKSADGGIAETMFHKAVFKARDGSKAGIVGVALDISARKKAERHLTNLNRILTVLSEINHLIIHMRESNSLLVEARRILQEKGGFPAVWIHTKKDGVSQFIADASMRRYAVRICNEIDNPERRCWPDRRLHCAELDCCNLELASDLRRKGLQSLIHLPMCSGGVDWGDIGILGSIGYAFSAQEQSLLEELASNLSFALNALLQQERRQEAENKLELSARVFDSSSEAFIITDSANHVLMVNRAFSVLTGYRADEVIGKSPSLLNSSREDAGNFDNPSQTLEEHGEWQGEVVIRRKSGEEFQGWLTTNPVRDDEGRLSNHVAVFSDLTAQKIIEARVDFLVHFDSLTGLPNRTHFLHRLTQALVNAQSAGKHIAVIYLDLDRFKLINETVGHVAADQLLIEVSSRLTAAAGNILDIARLNGDQFALLTPSLDSVDKVAEFVTQIQRQLGQSFQSFLESEIRVTASMGVSVFPDDGHEAEILVRNADSAMHSAIADGGNTCRFFRREMNQNAGERVQLESLLYQAMDRGELAVHFQPLVDATNGRIAGAESLLRWHCPELGGNVCPSIFIPLLEETRLVRNIGEWVLNQACAQLGQWQKIGTGELFVAVNISALQLTDDLPGVIAKAISDHAISPARLEIELTESAIMRDPEHGIRILHELKALGVRLSIDDFGTGYSSLSYLKRLPISTLKIDHSFVLDIPGDAEAVSITRAIMALGHALQLNIVAEGVETQEQAEFLCHNGCDLLQGYYFSKPANAVEFTRTLNDAPTFILTKASQPKLKLLTGK